MDAAEFALREIDREWGCDCAGPCVHCSLKSSIAAYRSLPPDPQDATLTADQEALLRRAVAVCHEMCRDTRERDVSFDSREMFRKRKNAMIDFIADAERLGITGDAK